MVQQCVEDYCDVDLQSSYLKAKGLEQRGFGSKHGFELKFFFSIFLKRNQIKINKAGVKLQAYVTLQIYCNPWIQNKIRRNVYENVKIWKYRISIFCTFYCKPSCMEAERHKCYFNFFSPSIHWDNYSRKKSFFSKLHGKCWQNWRNPWGIVNIPFCDVITNIGTCLFVTSS